MPKKKPVPHRTAAKTAAADPLSEMAAIKAAIEARVAELIAARVKPRHSADHWVPAAGIMGRLLEATPIPRCPEATPAGRAVGAAFLAAASVYQTDESRFVYSDAEKKGIESAAGVVSSIRKALDETARTPAEREAAHAYGVGGNPPGTSPAICHDALQRIVRTQPSNGALWRRAKLDDEDLAEVKALRDEVQEIVGAKKPRLVQRAGKRLGANRATLALEVWCDGIIAAVHRRLPDGHPAKGEFLAAARPATQRRSAERKSSAAKTPVAKTPAAKTPPAQVNGEFPE